MLGSMSTVMAVSMRRFWLTAVLGFALVVALIAVPSAFAIGYAFVAAEHRDHVTSELTLDVTRAERLHTEAERAASAARAYLLSGDPAFIPVLESARADFSKQERLLQEQTRRPDGTALLRRVETAAGAYSETVDRVLARAGGERAARADLARTFEEDMLPRHRALVDALDALDAFREAQVAELGRQADRAFVRGLTVSALATAGAMAASAAFAYAFARRLSRAYDDEHEAMRIASEALAARDDVLGVVAHDLRSPLTAIGMKAALIRKGTDPPAAPATPARSSASRSGWACSSRCCSTRRASTRAASPSRRSRRRRRRCSRTRERSSASWPPRGSVRLDVPAADPALTVMADRERVGQALGNLVANAIKFTPPGGAVVVRADPVDDGARFTVADSGPGIAPEQQAHVFDRFWQAKQGDERGAGLGLYIAKGIVEAHHGRIWIEAAPGKGSTFAFTLPRADIQRLEAPPTTLDEGRHPGEGHQFA